MGAAQPWECICGRRECARRHRRARGLVVLARLPVERATSLLTRALELTGPETAAVEVCRIVVCSCRVVSRRVVGCLALTLTLLDLLESGTFTSVGLDSRVWALALAWTCACDKGPATGQDSMGIFSLPSGGWAGG